MPRPAKPGADDHESHGTSRTLPTPGRLPTDKLPAVGDEIQFTREDQARPGCPAPTASGRCSTSPRRSSPSRGTRAVPWRRSPYASGCPSRCCTSTSAPRRACCSPPSRGREGELGEATARAVAEAELGRGQAVQRLPGLLPVQRGAPPVLAVLLQEPVLAARRGGDRGDAAAADHLIISQMVAAFAPTAPARPGGVRRDHRRRQRTAGAVADRATRTSPSRTRRAT